MVDRGNKKTVSSTLVSFTALFVWSAMNRTPAIALCSSGHRCQWWGTLLLRGGRGGMGGGGKEASRGWAWISSRGGSSPIFRTGVPCTLQVLAWCAGSRSLWRSNDCVHLRGLSTLLLCWIRYVWFKIDFNLFPWVSLRSSIRSFLLISYWLQDVHLKVIQF